MSQIGVMHLIDTLDAGGAETMAVHLANHLPRQRYCPYLTTTRAEGPLAPQLASDVGRLRLQRRRTLDMGALLQLHDFARRRQISILHAHATSLFVAAAVSTFLPRTVLIWHDHFGRHGFEARSRPLYRLATARVDGVIAVNQQLAAWSRQQLGVPSGQVWYVPNFVADPAKVETIPDLPGQSGKRIVCVANLRIEKNHPLLLQVMAHVIREVPDAHLLLVGGGAATQVERVRTQIADLGLGDYVSLLGQRSDVQRILKTCDIGVLSSDSEGLPLALIEYGMAGLAAVATDVGQCAEVLDGGRVGALVAPGDGQGLAAALVEFLTHPPKQQTLRERFQRHVKAKYSAAAVIPQVTAIYEQLVYEKQHV